MCALLPLSSLACRQGPLVSVLADLEEEALGHPDLAEGAAFWLASRNGASASVAALLAARGQRVAELGGAAWRCDRRRRTATRARRG